MNIARQLAQRGYAAAAALALLALAAALFPTEVGGHGGQSTLRGLAAVGAALVAVSVVPFATSMSELHVDSRLVVAATASAGAAAIHFGVISEHVDEYWLFGLFFFVSGVAQLGWAIIVVLRPLKPFIALGVVGNAGIIGLWIVSRTAGIPFGPDRGVPEAVGVADVIASALEGLLVASTVWYLARPGHHAGRSGSRTRVRVATLAITATVAVALIAHDPSTHHHEAGVTRAFETPALAGQVIVSALP